MWRRMLNVGCPCPYSIDVHFSKAVSYFNEQEPYVLFDDAGG
jgi:hypothetical protein